MHSCAVISVKVVVHTSGQISTNFLVYHAQMGEWRIPCKVICAKDFFQRWKAGTTWVVSIFARLSTLASPHQKPGYNMFGPPEFRPYCGVILDRGCFEWVPTVTSEETACWCYVITNMNNKLLVIQSERTNLGSQIKIKQPCSTCLIWLLPGVVFDRLCLDPRLSVIIMLDAPFFKFT
jgi:hypothetical protein